MTDTVDAVFNELKKQLSTFLLHTFVKRKQAASFDSLKNSCDGKSIVLQVDFSENVTIAAQKEVQAAHWHHAQATIFTTYTWINNATNFSTVVISDDLKHTKHSIFVFMQCIFQSLRAKFPSIETVNVFIDGPTSQFKQRFFFSNLHYWEQDHGISIRWNLFGHISWKRCRRRDLRDSEEGSLETHSVGEKSYHYSTRVFSTRQTALPKHSS